MRIKLHIGLSGKVRSILLLVALVFCLALQNTARAEDFEEGLAALESHDYATALSKFTKVVTEPAPKKSFTLNEFLEKAKPLNPDYSTEEHTTYWSRRYGPDREATIARAQFYIGLMHDFGRGVPEDDQEANRWYSKAAEAGHARAQFNLGIHYLNGEGVPKDYQQAVRWFLKAAQQEDPSAQHYLGLAYSNGEGVPQDYQQAVQWYRKAAEQGDMDAQFSLGLYYHFGRGLPQDYKQAFNWYKKSAYQGNTSAQNNLGNMYQHGEGIPQDYVQAHKWYNLAASATTDQEVREVAAKNRNSVERRMSPTQVAEAQRLAREWKPTTVTNSDDSDDGRAASLSSSGSGFVINRQGHVLTNYHVVNGCQVVQSTIKGDIRSLTIVGTDTSNDLAVLKLSGHVSNALRFREGRNIRSGDSVIVLGFPLHGLLASEATVTTGTIGALAGLGNDVRFLQITAPIQQGSSGGPVLDQSGHIVGAVVSKLDALRLAKATGDIPQNINFAINGTVLKAFLDANGVEYETGVSAKKLEPADIGAIAKRSTLPIECFR